MTEPDDFSPPEALRCNDVSFRFATPQWVVYDGRSEGQNCLAWAFLPAVARVELIGGNFAAPPLGPAYQAVSASVEDSAKRLMARGERGWCRPRAVARSAGQPLLWIRTQAPSTWLADSPARAPPGIRDFAEALTLTLSRLHEQRIFHLDVHPGLIGLAPDRQLVLCSFGADIRRALSAGQRDNRRLARPNFSPPELWDASGRAPLGPWTDVYGTAATLFERITGEPPPDFRDRLGEPGHGEAELVERMRAALREDERSSRLMAAAIVEGLAIRRSDRPSDIAAWGRKLAITSRFESARTATTYSPPPPPVPLPSPSPPAPSGSSADPIAAVLRGRAHPPRMTAQPAQRRGSGSGRYFALFGVVALIALLVLGKIYWLPGSPSDTVEVDVSAPDETLFNDVTAVEPIGTEIAEPAAPSGSLAGTAFEDDPAELAERLSALWGSLPDGFRPASLFLGYREPERGSCQNPLRIHLRRDGGGLILDRPAGLIWITRWSGAGSVQPGRIDFVIDSVWSRDGQVDAPGLVGTGRSLSLAGDEMRISMPAAGQDETGDREVYSPCPA